MAEDAHERAEPGPVGDDGGDPHVDQRLRGDRADGGCQHARRAGAGFDELVAQPELGGGLATTRPHRGRT